MFLSEREITITDSERQTNASASSDGSFAELDIDSRILRALLDDLEFESCTPIQERALPHLLKGSDLTGRAQTGTGKTAAFLITVLQHFLSRKNDLKSNQPFALVMAPTRELAAQIDRDAQAIGKYCGMRNVAVYGGMHYKRQKRRISQGVDLVSATPGRLLDYMGQGIIDLSRVGIFVIDEADRMLDMGFIPDVRRIVSRLSPRSKRQTMLFSATLSSDILTLVKRWMREPVTVEVDPEHVVAEGVEEVVYAVPAREKLGLLLWLLTHETCSRVLIFRNRRRDVEQLWHHLRRHDLHCEMLSGDVPQRKRMRIMRDFREGRIPVIVATDVAGRGIHIEGISHVINYDLPYEAENYVHRIGRTGRAGEEGRAISFACEQESFVIPEIEEVVSRELSTRVPEPEMVELPTPKHDHPHQEKSSGRSRRGRRKRSSRSRSRRRRRR